LFALLTVGGFNAIALGGLVCTRQLGQSLGLYTFIDNEAVSAIFSAVLVMYAISLGLITARVGGTPRPPRPRLRRKLLTLPRSIGL
jgi:hypothetical protein